MKNFSLRVLLLSLCVQSGFIFTAHGAASTGPSGGVAEIVDEQLIKNLVAQSDDESIFLDDFLATNYVLWAGDRLARFTDAEDGALDALFAALLQEGGSDKLIGTAEAFKSAIEADHLSLTRAQKDSLMSIFHLLLHLAKQPRAALEKDGTKKFIRDTFIAIDDRFDKFFSEDFINNLEGQVYGQDEPMKPEEEMAYVDEFIDKMSMAVGKLDFEKLINYFRANKSELPYINNGINLCIEILDDERMRLRKAGLSSEMSHLDERHNQLTLLKDALLKSLFDSSGGTRERALEAQRLRERKMALQRDQRLQAAAPTPIARQTIARQTPPAPIARQTIARQTPPAPIARQTIARQTPPAPIARQTIARQTPPAPIARQTIARQTPPTPIARQTIARQTPPTPIARQTIARPTPPSTPVETQPLIGGSALVGNPPRRVRSKAAATEVHRMMRGWQAE